MKYVDWHRIHSRNYVDEISLVAATFRILYPRAPRDLTIEILLYPHGQYMGVPNYDYWGPMQADPYSSLHLVETIEEAVDDVISGIRMFDRDEYPSELIFWVKGYAGEAATYIDGCGQDITYQEVLDRRKKNKRQLKTNN